MIPYGQQKIDDDDIAAVTKVLRSDYLTQGPEVENFENAFSTFVSAEFTIAVNSATSALHLACMAIDLGPRDILWTSPNSFVASANCGRYCGARVDFVDIDSEYLTICPKKLSEKFTYAKAINAVPKALVLVHFAGQVAYLEEISKLCKTNNVILIEDASHAIGAQYNGHYVGNCEYSDMTVFSLHPVKIITAGEGGLLTTNDSGLYKNAKMNRTHGITRDETDFNYKAKGPWFYEQKNLGYNYRMSDISAALGNSQLNKVRNFIYRRKEIFNFYNETLADLPLKLPKGFLKSDSSHHLYVIQTKENLQKNERSKLFNFLRERGIGVNVHYIPIHLQPYYREIGFKDGDFPDAEEYYENTISLPIHPRLSKENLTYIVNCLKNYFKRGRQA